MLGFVYLCFMFLEYFFKVLLLNENKSVINFGEKLKLAFA